MRAGLRHLWRELLRPRRVARAGARLARSSRSGIAILVVIATMMIMTVLVTDLTYGARVRFLVAHHQKDRTQALWLARSGYNIYRLILVANKDLESSSVADMLPDYINVGDALWQMIPTINTGLFRMLLSSGGDAEDIAQEDLQRVVTTGVATDEATDAEVEGSLFSDKSFLDFDGDFSVEVTDEESKININNLATDTATVIQDSVVGQQLYALMSGEDNDQWFKERNLDRWELIGNLKDWVDSDTTRSAGMGGYEDTLYNALPDPYLSKNAPFDTKDEIRLVEGWQDEVFEKFGKDLSVFGSGKFNLQTASDEVLVMLLRSYIDSQPREQELQICIDALQDINNLINWPPSTAKDFREMVESNCGYEVSQDLDKAVTKSSKTFTIISTGIAGTSSVTITAVIDFSSKGKGKLLYWRVD